MPELVRAAAWETSLSPLPIPLPSSLAVLIEKAAIAGVMARQRGSQETKYPNLPLLPPSDPLPLAKVQPETREQRTLSDEALRGISPLSPTPKGTDQETEGQRMDLGVGINGEVSKQNETPDVHDSGLGGFGGMRPKQYYLFCP